MIKPMSTPQNTKNAGVQFSRVIQAFRWRFLRLLNICVYGRRSSVPCNICNRRIFIRGPLKRFSATGTLPWCATCWSLERHRGLRAFWNKFPREFLEQQTVLQFSDDPSVEAAWFRSFSVSIFGGGYSLDLQEIDLPDSSYDIVICNQVLEHVPADRKALRELLRITKRNGFVQLGVPSPMTIEKTEDWGYPNKEKHGHYRHYGRDIDRMLDEVIGTGNYREFAITDPVTKAEDCIFLICHSAESLADITVRIVEKEIIAA